MPNERKTVLIGPISPAADGALYQQIVDGLKRRSAKAGSSRRDLALLPRAGGGICSWSVITVKRAYEELEREGIIYRRQGLGTFVADRGAQVQERYGLLLRQVGIVLAWGFVERSRTQHSDEVPVVHLKVEAIECLDRMPQALRAMSRTFH